MGKHLHMVDVYTAVSASYCAIVHAYMHKTISVPNTFEIIHQAGIWSHVDSILNVHRHVVHVRTTYYIGRKTCVHKV